MSRQRRRLRTIFSNDQLTILEQAYTNSRYPDVCTKKRIAKEARLPIDRVQVWFQNKRTRDKKLKEEKTEIKQLDDVTNKVCLQTSIPNY